MSLTDPSIEQLKAAVLWSQERAERLARRIVSASAELKGMSGGYRALSILDGREEVPVTVTERPDFVGPTPLADGLLDFGDWDREGG